MEEKGCSVLERKLAQFRQPVKLLQCNIFCLFYDLTFILFDPLKTTMLVISHGDCDGVASVAMLYKAKRSSHIPTFFTSANLFKDTLCRAMVKRKLDELYIFDLAGNKQTIRIASAFSKVTWIDHHEWYEKENFDNMEFVLEKTPSTCQLVAKHFGIESELIELVNQVDTNNIKSEDAEFLRDLIGSIKWKFSRNYVEVNRKLREISRDLAFKELQELQANVNFAELINEYKKWLEEVEKSVAEKIKVTELNGLKIAIYESLNFVPVYLVCNKLKEHELAPFDLIAVICYRKNPFGKISTKIELRTHTQKEVIKIAKLLNGGGHSVAAGISVNDLFTGNQLLDLLRKIEI
jgi:nanoRNase/pAp phosphatase (c-di-AMP/oligoRNAs hydrolase)